MKNGCQFVKLINTNYPQLDFHISDGLTLIHVSVRLPFDHEI